MKLESPDLFGKDLICTQDWSKSELKFVINLASKMKKDRFSPKYATLLKNKTFLMLFFNPSVRTRQSFEVATTELGGNAQHLEPKTMRLKTKYTAGETIEDVAQVMSRYGHGLGIRILEDKIGSYGEGDELIHEFAKWSSIPIISMAHDKYHPCQGLADVMGWSEWFFKGTKMDLDILKRKKLLITWGHGNLARSWCSVQEAMLISSRFGMDVTVAHPEGFELDPKVIKWAERNCYDNNASFETINHLTKGYEGAHVVISRHWMSPDAYKDDKFMKEQEIERALEHPDWICDSKKMALTDKGIFSHPMPIERGYEVTDEVASSSRSCIYDVAENRLHIQKAIMALTIGKI